MFFHTLAVEESLLSALKERTGIQSDSNKMVSWLKIKHLKVNKEKDKSLTSGRRR